MNKENNSKKLAEAWQDNIEVVVFKYFKSLIRDRSEEKALENVQVLYRGKPEGFERFRDRKVEVNGAEEDTLDEDETTRVLEAALSASRRIAGVVSQI